MEVMAHGNAVTACAEFYLDEENFRRLEIECEIIRPDAITFLNFK